MQRWIRLSSKKWEDAWEERLRFLGPEHVAFITWPNSRALKIEAYCDEKTAKGLVRKFGGMVAKLPKDAAMGGTAKPRPPLAIRGKLKICSDEASFLAAQAAAGAKGPRAIFVPAGMAFGTGEHATTATCLRMLCDLAPSLPRPWSALDLGTGTGILAIAAECLGAEAIHAIDNDPACTRITRENAKSNQCRRITVRRGDVLKDPLPAGRQLATANLYSELLIKACPRIAGSLEAGGWLIFSGVLRDQAAGVVSALVKTGFTKPEITHRGKWCAGICRKKTNNPC